MNLEAVILIVHVLLSITLIGLILIQHGKGADAGAAFGSGASGTVFGASGSGSFIVKVTTWLAIAFFATSLGLAYMATNNKDDGKIQFSIPTEQAPAAATTDSAVDKINQQAEDALPNAPAAQPESPALADEELPAAAQPSATQLSE